VEYYRVDMLRITYCLDRRVTGDGVVAHLTHGSRSTLQKYLLFLSVVAIYVRGSADRTLGPTAAGRIKQIDKIR
jgi:hypothetical protein